MYYVKNVLNNFFSNIIKTLGISECIQNGPLVKNVNNHILKAILKYWNHPSILAKEETWKVGLYLHFAILLEKRDIEGFR